MALESKKLTWAIDRDVSLLLNIFPKNLSDELKFQMEGGKTRLSKDNLAAISATEDLTENRENEREKYSIGEPEEGEEEDRERPSSYAATRINSLVKIISSFTGRERNGWRSLDSNIPLETHSSLPPSTLTLSSYSPRTSPDYLLDDLFRTPDSSDTHVATFPFPHDYISTPPISIPPIRITSEKSLSPSSSFVLSSNTDGGLNRISSRERSHSVPSPPLPTRSPLNSLLISTSFSRRSSRNSAPSHPLLSTPRAMSPRSIPPKIPKSRLAVLIPSSSFTSHVLSPMSHASSPHSSPIYSLPSVVAPKQHKSGLPTRRLASSGEALHTLHAPEQHTFFFGTQHADGSTVSLSHFYPSVSVILADISGFIAVTRSSTPRNVVEVLNSIFNMFDEIIEEYNFEKIRTIGDAYLCVANMSIPVQDHESQAIKAAHQMRIALKESKNFYLRVGIASGSCIAGVTGKTRWNYDIFGDVLTEAISMESATKPDAVSVSSSIYEACKDSNDFKFEKHMDNSGIERYSVTTTSSYTLEIGVDYSQSSDATDKYEEIPLFAPSIRVPKIDLLDDVDFMSKPEETEIPLTDFQYDDLNKFDYTKEDLEFEMGQLEQNKLFLAFHKFTFETEYLNAMLRKTYPFTSKFILLLLLTVPFYIIIDVCTTFPAPLKEGVFILHAFKFFLMFSYFWMVHHSNDWKYATHAGYVALALFSLSTAAIGFVEPTIYHVQRILLVLCTMSILLICGIYTQTNIERSFRLSFLVRKVIAFNDHHQKKAQHRTKVLIHNILPEAIIPRLLRRGKQIGPVYDFFEDATIMFVNIINLREATSHLNAKQAFYCYDEIISKFDEATKAHGLDKIKTVNTVYMIASGFPQKRENHTEAALNLAIELNHIAELYAIEAEEKAKSARLKLRVGIEVGPVIAGVVGKKKFSYDCWSETVNEAAKLEMNGACGFAHVSSNVHELLNNKLLFSCKESGKRPTYVCKL